jgi:hypothetical protein
MKISGMFGDIEGLQQEAEGTDLKLCDLVVAPIDGESEIDIKLFGEFGVLGGHERLEIGHGTRKH